MVLLYREPWEAVVEPQAPSLLVLGVEAAQAHDSVAQVARFFDPRREEARRISVPLVFLVREASWMVAAEEGAPVGQSA